MRVYHFLPTKYAFQNIANRVLKVASVNDLNDPFELLPFKGESREERRLFRHIREEFNQTFGMICFSKTWSDPVQWSHYADRHKGMCLGFDVPDDVVVPVTYSRNRLLLDASLYTEENVDRRLPEMMQWLTTKYIHWSYEQEVRIFIELQGSDPQKLNFRDL